MIKDESRGSSDLERKRIAEKAFDDIKPKVDEISLIWDKHKNDYKPKKKYTQDCPAYNAAKTNEDQFFKKLLHELLFLAIKDYPKNRRGPKGYSTRDKIFSMCIKIYYKRDLRRCESMLKELKKLGFIDKVPSFKSIDNFFNDKKLKKKLDMLIFVSALPVANLEETGAVDSTCFGISRYDRWFDHKWGKDPNTKKKVWRKAHACTGCKTNVFLSIELTPSNVSDIRMVDKVVDYKLRYFNMKEFVADKAYLSKDILEFIDVLNLTPFIPFKRKTTCKAGDPSMWRKMYKYFINDFNHYMSRYHQRSNVETSFHMLKQCFGSYLMTKNLDANCNEVKIKALCHNLSCLIQEVFESSIEIDFESCVKIAESV